MNEILFRLMQIGCKMRGDGAGEGNDNYSYRDLGGGVVG